MKGIGEMLDQHRKEMHEQFSQILSVIGKSKTPKPEAPNFAITTRSGVNTRDPPFPTPANHTEGATEKEGSEGVEPSIIHNKEPAHQPSIFYQPFKSSNMSFPSIVKKPKKDDEDERLLSIFKWIHINLSFLEAMIHMPMGANVLKDLLSHKEKLEKAASSVKLSEECSAIIQRSLPQKEGDPGSFTLSCLIGPLVVKNALADLRARLIYPISDSPWVSPVQVVPKKGGMTVVKNEKNKLISQRTVTGWRVMKTTASLDGFLGYCHIPIDPGGSRENSHSLPYETFHIQTDAFRIMQGSSTFLALYDSQFPELIEAAMEVSIDDFFVFGSSFDHYLKNLEKMLKRCEETDLVLNWENATSWLRKESPLAISSQVQEIEVNKAKSKQIPNYFPTKPDWSLPFEVVCDASDYTVGAVLGKRIDKHFKPIHYARKTMNEAQESYTTTKKELLAIVFAFDKFCQYLVISKTIVFTDHFALRYLFTKQDAKSNVPTESYEGASSEMRHHKSFGNVTTDHLEDITVLPLLQEKSLKPVSIAHSFRNAGAGQDWG
ncbi:reverse transcriptase domain-containing protein [Tanacetum coccineum]